MVELDEATRQALLARERPPVLARAEVLAGLRSRLGGPGGPDDLGEPNLEGGESMPIDKAPGDEVFAGTINGHGAIEVAVTRLRRDTTLARSAASRAALNASTSFESMPAPFGRAAPAAPQPL